jgi:hypothetical protein
MSPINPFRRFGATVRAPSCMPQQLLPGVLWRGYNRAHDQRCFGVGASPWLPSMARFGNNSVRKYRTSQKGDYNRLPFRFRPCAISRGGGAFRSRII